MNLNTNVTDGWGWYIDLENNTFINVETKELKNERTNKKFNYHFNRLDTIKEEYEYYYNNYGENENNSCDIYRNCDVKKTDKPLFIKFILITNLITPLFYYLKTIIFKLRHLNWGQK